MTNNRKSSVSPLFTQFEVVTFTVEKVECFAQKFPFDSTLKSLGVPLLNFPPRTEALMSVMCIIPILVSDTISKLGI